MAFCVYGRLKRVGIKNFLLIVNLDALIAMIYNSLDQEMNSASLVLGLQVLFGVEILQDLKMGPLCSSFSVRSAVVIDKSWTSSFLTRTHMLMMGILLFKNTSNLGVQGSPGSTIYHSQTRLFGDTLAYVSFDLVVPVVRLHRNRIAGQKFQSFFLRIQVYSTNLFSKNILLINTFHHENKFSKSMGKQLIVSI